MRLSVTRQPYNGTRERVCHKATRRCYEGRIYRATGVLITLSSPLPPPPPPPEPRDKTLHQPRMSLTSIGCTELFNLRYRGMQASPSFPPLTHSIYVCYIYLLYECLCLSVCLVYLFIFYVCFYSTVSICLFTFIHLSFFSSSYHLSIDLSVSVCLSIFML